MLDSALWEDLVGEPYVLKGRGNPGYDCYGLLFELYKRRGIIIADFQYGEDRADQIQLLAINLHKFWRKCPVQAGAGLLFLEDGSPGHVGMAIDEDLFIHASQAVGQVALGRLSRLTGLKLLSAYEPN